MFVRNDCKVKTRDAVSPRVYNRRPFKRRSSLNITISCLLIISETELVWIESNIRVCPSYNNNVIIVNVDRNMVKSRDPRVYLMF